MGNYRWASKVRVDPPLDGTDGVWMFAGKVEDGAERLREADGEQERVTLEVLKRFHADQRMTADEVLEFAKQQDDDERWDDDE